MSTTYEVINLKESNFDGAENVSFSCYSSAPGKYLMCGRNTESLKMKRDDYNFVMRSHNYNLDDLPGKIITPSFGRYDYVEDFTLSDPQTGEVI